MVKKEMSENIVKIQQNKSIGLKLIEFMAYFVELLIFAELSKPFWPFWISLYNFFMFGICLALLTIVTPFLQNKVDDLYQKLLK